MTSTIANITLDAVAVASSSWLLTYLIHSTILILGVWLIVRGIPPLARRISPKAENLAWKFALIGGLVSASVQFGLGVRPVFGALELGEQPVARTEVRELEVSRQIELRQVEDPTFLPGDDLVVIGSTRPIAAANPLALAPLPRFSGESASGLPWPRMLFGAALLASTLALAWLILSVIRLRRRLADRSDVVVDPALEQFLTLCRDAQIDRKIRLTHTTELGSPIALGRSEVVIPSRAVDELSAAALRSVFAHELAHLERRDPAWLSVAVVIEALCCFQPLNRLARRGMQESAELICDDWAIRHTRDGVEFAKSLAELATWNHEGQPAALVSGMISGERPLVRRVRRALDGDPARLREEGPRPARAALGLGSLAALIMLAPGAVDASPPSAEQAPSKRELRAQRKLEREADKAQTKAEKARADAEKARKAAEQAQAEADRLEREAAAAERSAGIGGDAAARSLTLRDGADYLIIDEKGIRAREGRDGVEIDDQRVRIMIDGHVIDLDMESLGGLGGLGDLGGLGGELGELDDALRMLEDLQHEGTPSQQHGVLDPREFEGSFDELEQLGEALEGLGGLEGLEGLEGMEEFEDIMRMMEMFDSGMGMPEPIDPNGFAPMPPAPPQPPTPPQGPTSMI